jgi:endonuclease YncB( thermonuclease family)
MRRDIRAFFAILFLSCGTKLSAETLTGRVVGVSDGDTITVLDETNHQTRIRLHQIDAPEKSQDFGARSKQSLSDLVSGKQVSVEVATTDKYGRTVGKVLVGDVDANLEQVKQGMAWVYRQYANDPAYFAAEEAAKSGKLGLWSQSNPAPPWEFRHGGKLARAGHTVLQTKDHPTPPKSGSNSSFACGEKSRCGNMDSCAEARFYLEKCGLRKLDRDGDGVPCESLCR